MSRVAVVGHVEWVDFIVVEKLPTRGELIHAERAFTRAAGGGGVAAVVLAELGADVDFFCALGDDADGQAAAAQLRDRGVRPHITWRDQPTRRAVTLLEPAGERTIVTIGERLQPLGGDELEWDRLRAADGVYFTAGDAGALERARQARALVASPRGHGAFQPGGPRVEAVVFSADDREEHEWAARLEDRARLMVQTEGRAGGRWWGEEEGRWSPAHVPGKPRDAFGCGDTFAAGFTFGLAEGTSVARAAAIGAERGALCLTRVGAP